MHENPRTNGSRDCIAVSAAEAAVEMKTNGQPFRESVYGYCYQLDGSLISWKSNKFSARPHFCSSMKAEYIANGEAIKKALHIR
jgi:hypothetical protein